MVDKSDKKDVGLSVQTLATETRQAIMFGGEEISYLDLLVRVANDVAELKKLIK